MVEPGRHETTCVHAPIVTRADAGNGSRQPKAFAIRDSVMVMMSSMGHVPGDYCRYYYPGTLSCSQVFATHLKIGHP